MQVLIYLVHFSYQGVLSGYDQRSDIVLSEAVERIYSMDEGVEEVPLGLYLVKGDQMYALCADRFFLLCCLPRYPQFADRRA